MTLTSHHTDDHNTLRGAMVAQATRLGVTIDVGGPYHIGDPAHIQEHNRTTTAMKVLAGAVAYTGPLPPERNLGDTGHVTDHQLWDNAITAIGKMDPPKVTIVHSASGAWKITDYSTKLQYSITVIDGQATLAGDTITFQSPDGTVSVDIAGSARKIVTRKQYTYHDHYVPYQSCYNPCGNCRTDVDPHTWGCGCGSPCGDSGGGAYGDCVCHGPGYNERVKDDTPAGFTDEYGEWSLVADPTADRHSLSRFPVTGTVTVADGWLTALLPFSQRELPELVTDLFTIDGQAVYSVSTDVDLIRYDKDDNGAWWYRLRVEAPWAKPGSAWHWTAYEKANYWKQEGTTV